MIRTLCAVSFAILTLIAGGAHATQDGWPALYDVSDVAADDMLNVRASPDATSDVIGTLAPDAQGIEVIEANDAQTWGRINMGERSGWTSLRFITRRVGQYFGAELPVSSCFGTEPFWTLAIADDDTVRYSALGEAVIAGRLTARVQSTNRRDESALLLDYFTAGRGTATVTQAACGDGMSDRAYGLRVNLLQQRNDGPTLLSGCCTLSR